MDQAVAVRLNRLNGCGQQAVTSQLAPVRVFARTCQAFPQAVALASVSSKLDWRNMSQHHQPRRNNANVNTMQSPG